MSSPYLQPVSASALVSVLGFALVLASLVQPVRANESITGYWEIYQRALPRGGEEHFAQLTSDGLEQYLYDPPNLVLYCVDGESQARLFIGWARNIGHPLHELRLQLDQDDPLLMNWLAGPDGEKSWIARGRIIAKTICAEEQVGCTPRRVRTSQEDLLEKFGTAESLVINTTDQVGVNWPAKFSLRGVKGATQRLLNRCAGY